MNQYNANTYPDYYDVDDALFLAEELPSSKEIERQENLELIGILLTEEFEDAFQEDVFAGVA